MTFAFPNSNDLSASAATIRPAVTFTCEGCHSSTFEVTTVAKRRTGSIRTLRCDCERKSLAAVHFVEVRERRWYRGVLDTDLKVTAEVEIEREDEFLQNDLTVGCEDCFDKSEDRWVEWFRTEDVEDPSFKVTCAHCNREIEFGWTDGPRLGRIVPVESSAFDAMTFPEPRFVEGWRFMSS